MNAAKPILLIVSTFVIIHLVHITVIVILDLYWILKPTVHVMVSDCKVHNIRTVIIPYSRKLLRPITFAVYTIF